MRKVGKIASTKNILAKSYIPYMESMILENLEDKCYKKEDKKLFEVSGAICISSPKDKRKLAVSIETQK